MPAIPIHHTPVEDGLWDSGAELKQLSTPISESVAEAEWAWYASNGSHNGGYPDTKHSYRLPHHFVSDGQPGAASVHAVRNALARLEHTDMPESDRALVKAHLQMHLSDYWERRNGYLNGHRDE